jgi:tetratricopeptide (TPR) repeat protein
MNVFFLYRGLPKSARWIAVSKIACRFLFLFFFLSLLLLLQSIYPDRSWGQSLKLDEAQGRTIDLVQQGKLQEAIPHAKIAVELGAIEYGDSHPRFATTLNNLGLIFLNLGRFEEAEPLFLHSIVVGERASAMGLPSDGGVYSNLAELYREVGQYAEAEIHYKQSLKVVEKMFGARHPKFATALNNLALLYQSQSRYAEAGQMFVKSLEILEEESSHDATLLGKVLGNLAINRNLQGRYSEVRSLLRRAISSAEKSMLLGHPVMSKHINNLAEFEVEQGFYDKANDQFNRSLAIIESTLGVEHPDVATVLVNQGRLQFVQGRDREAKALFSQALALRTKIFGQNHPDVATSLNQLANVFVHQGRYLEAEQHYMLSLKIKETALGIEHPEVAGTLARLGELYFAQGRRSLAESFFKRSLNIYEKRLGANHIWVASLNSSLGKLYLSHAQYVKAEPLLKKSMLVRKKYLPANHPKVGSSLNELALLYTSIGRPLEAENYFNQALTVFEMAVGNAHPVLATLNANIGILYSSQGQDAKALSMFERSLAISENSLRKNHPDVATSLNNIAFVLADQWRFLESLDYRRRSTTILRNRFTSSSVQESKGLLSEQRGSRFGFYAHVDMALHPEQTEPRPELEQEAFEVLQLARTSSAGSALGQMAVRFASGSDAVSELVRLRQDAVHQYEALDKKLLEAVSAAPDKRSDDLIMNLRKLIAGLKEKIPALDREIAGKFPGYAALTSREPLPVGEIRSLLGSDEALLTFIRSWKRDKTHVFVVRSSGLKVYTVPVGLEAIRQAVDALRKGLDFGNARSLSNLPSFNTTVAYELYQKLFGPAEKMLEGVNHLFVVPTGPLQSLPLGVLVTSRPEKDVPAAPANDNNEGAVQTRGLVTVPGKEVTPVAIDPKVLAAKYSHYRDVPWLARRYALTTLPSVASLKALRVFASRTRANKPFIGFGDPTLEGDPGNRKGVQITAMFRGAVANVDEVRKLSRLPGTADELRSMARYLGAKSSSVYLGNEATETRVKEMDLKNTRVVAFSTHGLVSGEIRYLAEPALVLTPPGTATEQDDGLLTASEIAHLKLDAEWVILSACNTAQADQPGAQGLSGLAKAFFYAGSRALLVSHWPVESNSATALTEGLFRELNQHPDIGRSEALRRSMFRVAANDNHPQWAHPAYWAPFVVVGEGLRR